MRKLIAASLVGLLTLAACASSPEEATRDDIAALEDEKDEGAGGKKGKQDDSGGTPKPKKDGGAGKKKPAGGGASSQTGGSGGSGGATEDDGGGGGGGGSTRPQAAPITPVPAARYEYATNGQRTISGNTSELPKETTLTAGTPADGVQRQTRDLRDSEGNGTVTETDLVYRDGSVFLAYVKVTSRFQGGLTDVREFRLPQPQLVAPRGGGPGFGRSFTMQGSGTRAKVTIKAHRFEDVTVGGQTIRALVVETIIEFSGSLEGHQTSMAWFWPKHLLTLREDVRTDVTNGPIRLQSQYVAQLRRMP